MATVTNTITKPGGEVAPRATVIIELVAGTEITSGFVTATDAEVIGRYTFSAGDDGAWSKTLTANSEITPANTMYRITEQAVGDADSRTVWYVVVPAGAGTHPVVDIRYDPVTAVPTVEPSNEVDYAEITANVNGIVLSNALLATAVAGLTVTIPDLARPVWLEASATLQVNTANTVGNIMIAPVGSTLITQAIAGQPKRLTAAATGEGFVCKGRLAAHTPGDYGVFISSAAGTWDVVAATYAPCRVTALAV